MTIEKSSQLLKKEYLQIIEGLLKDFALIHQVLRKRYKFYQFLLPDLRPFWKRWKTVPNQICSVVVRPLHFHKGPKPGWMTIRIRVFGKKFSELVKFDLVQPIELTAKMIPQNIKFDLSFELESKTPVVEDKRSTGLFLMWNSNKRGKLLIGT